MWSTFILASLLMKDMTLISQPIVAQFRTLLSEIPQDYNEDSEWVGV